jgi:RimJ/RimL family protein N-acetyltransferase
MTLSQSDFTLKDGTRVHVRPIRPEDDHRLVDIFNASSPQTVYQRFFTALPELTPEMARDLSSVDYVQRLALIAETGAEPIGVARYESTRDPGMAELGLVVVDGWQNRGIGRILLREILCAAGANGIHRFCADVLGENHRMLHLLATEGQLLDTRTEAGVTTVTLRSRTSAPAAAAASRRPCP